MKIHALTPKPEKTKIIHHEITKVQNHEKGHNKFRAF